MATLKALPVNPRTKVFRAICQILKLDPVLRSVIAPKNFRCWAGDPQDNVVFEFSNCPAIRITPTTGPDTFCFPTAMKGWLVLDVDMLIPGNDADDQLNLWWTIAQALYPDVFATQQAVIATLQAAGAYTGLCEFSSAFDPSPSDRFFAARGQIRIEVLSPLTG